LSAEALAELELATINALISDAEAATARKNNELLTGALSAQSLTDLKAQRAALQLVLNSLTDAKDAALVVYNSANTSLSAAGKKERLDAANIATATIDTIQSSLDTLDGVIDEAATITDADVAAKQVEVTAALDTAIAAVEVYEVATAEFTEVATDAVTKNSEVEQTEKVASAEDALQTIADTTASLAAT